MTDLDALRELLGKASPRPWTPYRHTKTSIHAPGERGVATTGGYSTNMIPADVLQDENEANADLIITAVNSLPALLDELEALREVRDRAEALMGVLGDGGYFPSAGEPKTRRLRQALDRARGTTGGGA